MKTINVFTENIFSGWEIDEKDVIDKTRKMLEYYISTLEKNKAILEYDTKTYHRYKNLYDRIFM